MLPALLLTIMRKGRVLGAPVISMSTRHMLADIRIRPPRKDAVEQLQATQPNPSVSSSKNRNKMSSAACQQEC
jgi:hypothetical protein